MFSDDFYSQYLSFYAKKVRVKKCAHFPDYVPLIRSMTSDSQNPEQNDTEIEDYSNSVIDTLIQTLEYEWQ